MNAQQYPSLFDINYTLNRKCLSWLEVTEKQQGIELRKVCAFLFLHPASSSREISLGTGIERTTVCRVLATPKNRIYFDIREEKVCNITKKTVTAYYLTDEGIKYLEDNYE